MVRKIVSKLSIVIFDILYDRFLFSGYLLVPSFFLSPSEKYSFGRFIVTKEIVIISFSAGIFVRHLYDKIWHL